MADSGFPPPDELLTQADFVRAVARATLARDDLVDDVVQDTWVAAIERPPRVRRTLRGWLAGVTRRKAVDAIRRESATRRRERERARPEPTPGPDEIVSRAETGRILVNAVLDLGEPYRTTILLRFYDGLSRREIARRLDVPVETVHTRLGRGLAKLRARLAHALGDGPQVGWRAAIAPLIGAPAGASLATGFAVRAAGVMGKKLFLVGSLVLSALVVGSALVIGLRALEEGTQPASRPDAGLVAAADPEAPPPPPAEPAPPRVPVEEEPQPPPAEEGVPAPETAEPDEEDEGPTLGGTGAAPAAAPPETTPEVAIADVWEVDRELDLHGVVVREDGTPVANARLEVVFRSPDGPHFVAREAGRRERGPGPSTTSDASGRFALRLKAGQVVDLHARASGLASVGLRNLQPGERVRVVLSKPVSLLVLTQGPGRRPVPGLPLGLQAASRLGPGLRCAAVTDAHGRATFEGLPPSLPVHLSTRGRQEGLAWASRSLTLPAEGEDVVVLEVPPGRTLRGRVVDAATRQPIANATVGSTWYPSSTSALQWGVLTDEDGRYVLPGWSPRSRGGRGLEAMARGYALAERPVGSRQVVDFALERGVKVTGRTVDAKGAPVPDALLAAEARCRTRLDVENVRSLDSARSGADGRFVLDGLAADVEHRLFVVAEGHGYVRRRLPAIEHGGTLGLGDLVLRDAGRIVARLLTADGTPLARHEVFVSPADGEARGPLPAPPLARGFTDDLGRARLGGLAPGPYVLWLGPPLPNFRAPVEIPKEGGAAEVELRTRTRTITVTVVDDLDAPVEGAVVRAVDFDRIAVRDRFCTRRTTDASGHAMLPVQPGVPVHLCVIRPNDASYVVPPERAFGKDVDEVRLVVTRTRGLSGTLLDPDGEPIPHGLLEAEGARGATQRILTDGDGAFHARLDASGPVTLRFQGLVGPEGLAARKPWTAVVENVASGGRDVVVRAHAVPTDRRLEVVVLDPGGRPAPGVLVRLDVHEEGRPTDGAGRVAFEDLPALPIRVELEPEASRDRPWAAPETPEVVPDGQVVERRLLRGRLVHGRMLLPDGSARAGGSLRARWVSPTPPAKLLSKEVPVEADGRFVVVLDPAVKGPFTLVGEAVDSEGRTCRGTLDVFGPGDEEVTLTLRVAAPAR